jgi:hypothetical protein
MIQVSNRNYPQESNMDAEAALEFGQQCSVELDYQYSTLGTWDFMLESVEMEDAYDAADTIDDFIEVLQALMDAAMDTRDGFRHAADNHEEGEEDDDD